MRHSISLVLLFVLAPVLVAAPVADFTTGVKPILAKHCLACHGEAKSRGGLRLDRKADALKGGDNGKLFATGKPRESAIWHRVTATDDTRMPPKGERLSTSEIGILEAWIAAGASWPDDGSMATNPNDWWSFQPLRKTPTVAGENPIDTFIQAKWKAQSLAPAPTADRRTLIRRLHFDLVGLPPSQKEVDAFVADRSPNAYEKLVDSLLASPHYGERWARHWLDVVHFGETHGYDKDKPRPNAWPYRDYVIRALNSDKPYGRFVKEQIAGDVLFPGSVDGIEALGFLSSGPWDFIGHAELPESKIDGKIARHLDRDDFVANTMSTFVGLTVHCAQCHNHKFDPIRHEDYYRLQAVFAAIDRTDKAYDADPAITVKRAALEKRKADADSKAKLLKSKPGAELTALEATSRELDAEIRALAGSRRVAFIGAVHTGEGNFFGTGASGGKPRPIAILPRGDVTKPGKDVAPGVLAIPGVAALSLPANPSEGDCRAALAKWLTDANHPLTWRVMANRVWQYHFGRGLVDTPNDYGKMGQLPSHPELLDFLANELRQHQSLKTLHKTIVTSATYRLSSESNPANEKVDSENRYLWRQNRRKLEAEAIRDSILLAAGKLDLKMGGPGFQDFVVEKPEHSPHYLYHLHDPDDVRSHRRTIYRFVVRSQQQPFLASLDCADPSLSVDKRNQTLTPQQALALLNNNLSVAMAKHFATRVEALATDDVGRIRAAFQIAIGREPTATERETLVVYVQKHGLANGCRVILNLNEFAFVD